MKNKDRYEVLFEEVLAQNQAIYELVEGVPGMSRRLERVEMSLAGLKVTVTAIGKAVKDHSGDIAGLKIHTHFPA